MTDTRLCPWDRQVMTATEIDGKTFYICPSCGHQEFSAVLVDSTTITDLTED